MIEFYKNKESLNKITEDKIKGCNFVKYAMAVAVAGHHNIVVSGSDGCGKSLLLKHLPNLMPKLIGDEIAANEKTCLDIGLAGKYFDKQKRPFRTPHNSIGIERFCGGGVNLSRGEVTLADNGILFLDDAVEFKTSVLQMLRVPLESKEVCLSRAGHSVIYPANFQLAMTVKPCPCGNLGSKDKVCLCSQRGIEFYQKKISAPLYDRIAIKIDMNNFIGFDFYTEEELQEKIKRAWEKMFSRVHVFNNDLEGAQKYCLNEITDKAKTLYNNVIEKYNLTFKQQDYLLKVARTVADMEAHNEIYEDDMRIAMGLSKLGFGI